jgi:hypothetical protein
MKAFPLYFKWDDDQYNGMDLRDYFAKDFATTLIAKVNLTHDEEFIQNVCKRAYVWADAMMEARKK